MLKILRGKQLAITVPASADAQRVMAEAVRKHEAYRQIDPEEVQHLLYPTFDEVFTLAGNSDPFSVERYAEDSGHNYNRVTLYLCSEEDFLPGENGNEVSLSVRDKCMGNKCINTGRQTYLGRRLHNGRNLSYPSACVFFACGISRWRRGK